MLLVLAMFFCEFNKNLILTHKKWRVRVEKVSNKLYLHKIIGV